MKHRGDTRHGIALVGLCTGKVQRKMNAWAGFNFLFQRITVQVNHARDQQVSGQVKGAGVAHRFGVECRNEAVVDQDGYIVTHLGGKNDTGVGQK